MSMLAEQERMLSTLSTSQKVVLPGSKEFEEMFPIVDIESVSLQDSFMQCDPKLMNEKRFKRDAPEMWYEWNKTRDDLEWGYDERVKNSIILAKKIGMKNFRKPCMDPSFADDGETIIYCAGKKPALGKSAVWWEKNALNFMPEKNSCQMDELEKDVFLGTIIKYLVEEEKYEVEKAWEVVCCDSTNIGHYCDSKDAKRDFESTGSRKIGKWYDLGNTFKIVKRRGISGFMGYGGYYHNDGFADPLAIACVLIDDPYWKYERGVGEIRIDV